MGKIVVLGASPNPSRFSYKAIRVLIHRGYQVIAIGNKPGRIGNLEISLGKPLVDEVDKVVLYLNASNQTLYYSYILNLRPSEILFNPGTENPELAQLAIENGIDIRYDCALVLLDSDYF